MAVSFHIFSCHKRSCGYAIYRCVLRSSFRPLPPHQHRRSTFIDSHISQLPKPTTTESSTILHPTNSSSNQRHCLSLSALGGTLALAAYKSGEYDEAITAIEEGSNSDAQFVSRHQIELIAAHSLLKLGRFPEALDFSHQFLQNRRHFSPLPSSNDDVMRLDCLSDMARLHWEHSQFAECLTYLAQIKLKKHPTRRKHLCFYFANSHQRLGHSAKAIRAYEHCLADSDNVCSTQQSQQTLLMWHNLGVLYHDAGEHEQASRCFSELSADYVSEARLEFVVALSCHRCGRVLEALRLYRAVLSRQSESE